MNAGRRITGLLGLLGVLLCLLATAGVWLARTRVTQSIDQVFATVDGSLEIVRDRVRESDDRVEQAATMAGNLQEVIAGRIAAPDVEAKIGLDSENLRARLAQVDHWLEVSESALTLLHNAIHATDFSGATSSLESLRESLRSARSQLDQAEATADKIRQRALEVGTRVGDQQATKLAKQTVRIIGQVDSRLQQFDTKLSETRERLRALNVTIRRWSAAAASLVTLFLAWMGAGQLALCGWGFSKTK